LYKLLVNDGFMRKISLIICLIGIAGTAFSQSFYAARRERSIILTGGLGTSTYYGDMANSSDIIAAQPNINAGLQYYFTNRIGARVELNWFTLAGDDAKADVGSGRDKRGLSFQSSNFELSAVGIVNLFAHGDRYYRRPGFNVYGFAGIALLYFNPRSKDASGNLVALQPLKTEGVDYSLVSPAIPYGLGARLKVTPQFNIAVEAGWRKLFTDYLDDLSGSYPGLTSFTGPDAAQSQYFSDRRSNTDVNFGTTTGIRGNPQNDDAYMLLNMKIEYYLPLDFGGGGNKKSYSKKRSSMYRYNKKGRLRK
jgi:Domain of unknown function (DUF6089)